MAQKPTPFCTTCGTPITGGQSFCSNCGTPLGTNISNPTMPSSNPPQAGWPNVAAPAQLPTTGPTIPNTNQPFAGPQANTGNDPYLTNMTPPPPPPVSGTYNPYTANAPGGPQTYEQNASAAPVYMPPPAPGTYNAPVPPYAQAKKSHGCLITSVILLLVLAAGIGGFVFLNKQNKLGSSSANSTPGSYATSSTGNGSTGGSTPASSNSTPGASVGSSEQLDLTITYASIKTTIKSAQLARSFADDHSSNGSAGVVRLNLHEENTTTGNPRYLESDVMLLVLPDGTTVQSTQQQQFESPDGGVSRDNWVDFAMNSQVTLDQLTLRFGPASVAQMVIPLKPHADISKYQDKTSSPNQQFQYSGLDWTLKTARLSYSYADKQATAGNLYVIVTLAAVNHSANTFRGLASDFTRMQAGNSTQPPDNYTFPIEVATQGTAEGIIGFLVPQDATSFTLIMVGHPTYSPPIPQVTQTFQIP